MTEKRTYKEMEDEHRFLMMWNELRDQILQAAWGEHNPDVVTEANSRLLRAVDRYVEFCMADGNWQKLGRFVDQPEEEKEES